MKISPPSIFIDVGAAVSNDISRERLILSCGEQVVLIVLRSRAKICAEASCKEGSILPRDT